jgi:MoaA/NifB/PqqE/SkfB family radical SAM enzyme
MRLISLGFHCNNACIFCAQGKLRTTPHPVDPDSAVEEIVAGEPVAFVGGEPTLSDRLPDLIRRAEAKGASRIVVQTNGRRLAYRAYARTLAETSRRLVLDVSLHGSNDATHEYHTGTPGSFKHTALGLRHAQMEGLPVGVTTVVTRSNYRHLSEIIELVRRLGGVAIHFLPVDAEGRARGLVDSLMPTPELLRPYLSQAVTEARKRGIGVVVAGRGTPEEAVTRFAGIGTVEPEAAPPPPAAEPAEAPRRLPLVGAEPSGGLQPAEGAG